MTLLQEIALVATFVVVCALGMRQAFALNRAGEAEVEGAIKDAQPTIESGRRTVAMTDRK